MYLLRVLPFIRNCGSIVSEHVWIGGGGLRGGGVGSSYQPGVYVPLKALFLVKKVVILIGGLPLLRQV